jgi:hypothetical protein
MNPNGTTKNLRRPWVKGEPSPNPSGRPRRLPISDTYALFAAAPIPESIRRALKRKGIHIDPGATFADVLGLQMWTRAMGGDPKAAKEIRESIEGKAAQRPPEPRHNGPVELHVVYDNPLPRETGLEADRVPSPEESPKKDL